MNTLWGIIALLAAVAFVGACAINFGERGRASVSVDDTAQAEVRRTVPASAPAAEEVLIEVVKQPPKPLK